MATGKNTGGRTELNWGRMRMTWGRKTGAAPYWHPRSTGTVRLRKRLRTKSPEHEAATVPVATIRIGKSAGVMHPL
jgi:hypothetical protein